MTAAALVLFAAAFVVGFGATIDRALTRQRQEQARADLEDYIVSEDANPAFLAGYAAAQQEDDDNDAWWEQAMALGNSHTPIHDELMIRRLRKQLDEWSGQA